MTKSLHTLRYRELFHQQVSIAQLQSSVPASKRVVIFSDSHFDSHFDEARFQQFREIIESADMVVINGDFWADKTITFNEFVNSEWKRLFPLLKQKKAFYIFGNHDMPAHSDQRIFEFCEQAGFSLKLSAGSIQLHIEHGHLRSGLLVKLVLTTFEMRPKLLQRLTSPLEIVNYLDTYLFKKTRKHILGHLNHSFKHQWKNISEYLVMGHTHIPELDHEHHYLNVGLTHNGFFSYAVIQNNQIQLISQ